MANTRARANAIPAMANAEENIDDSSEDEDEEML